MYFLQFVFFSVFKFFVLVEFLLFLLFAVRRFDFFRRPTGVSKRKIWFQNYTSFSNIKQDKCGCSLNKSTSKNCREFGKGCIWQRIYCCREYQLKS
uniref:Uncharacterized protein n=1 Tax=Meloidogyne enterolobii TaxID=390850 RepID=A0A6V7W7L2_MELEN|nr:unnamed protein product [Meloidogyne enterolobii]